MYFATQSDEEEVDMRGLGTRGPSHAWLLAWALLIAGPTVFLATSGIGREYTAAGALWVEPTAEGIGVRPVSAGAPALSGWIELLRSYQVLEPVVAGEGLVLDHAARHADVFRLLDIEPTARFRPGTYTLTRTSAERFTLHTADGALVDEAPLGVPIGAAVGLEWTPPATVPAGSSVTFALGDVRDAARQLSSRLRTVASRDGSFLRLEYAADDPEHATRVLNALMVRHVAVAAELKQRRLDETLVILEEQLGLMERELEEAERNVELFLTDPGAMTELGEVEHAMEEARLRRQLTVSENLYGEIRGRVETARLAVASSIPDVRILDAATVTDGLRVPAEVLVLILLACLGTALGLMLTLGRVDARFPASELDAGVGRLRADRVAGRAILVGTVLAMLVTWLLALA